MKLHNILKTDRILLDFSADKRETVIEKLVNVLAETNGIADPKEVTRLVLERENEVGTGIGYGVAIPHTEPGAFSDPLIVFCRLKTGVNFHSPDGGTARLIFLLLTPENTPALHVRLLARICRLMKPKSVRNDLLEAETPQDVANIIIRTEADFPELTA
ncbi:PTS sugar transporter subunit IIA [bacterium]|nr:PTS sugar transporter subunit IIA [bacterium]